MAAVTAPTPAIATFPGANGKIVYDTYEQDTDGCCPSVYVRNPDGSGSRRLAGDGEGPVWSPDGTRIAYADLYTDDFEFSPQIWVMNADGTDKIPIPGTEGGRSPSWSPQGDEILFTTFDDVAGLKIVQLDGDGLRTVVDDAYAAEWSPDGTRIAFQRYGESDSDIFISAIDGSNVTQVSESGREDWSPSWSPDGEWIAFSSEATDSMNTADIYKVQVSGGSTQRLTTADGNDLNPAWSPDGTKITFVSGRSAHGTYVMNADGSGQTQITGPGTPYEGLTTSPISQDWQACPASDDCPGGELVDPVATTTSLTTTRTADSLIAAGTVSPAQAGQTVTVKLKKKKDGRFRLVKKKVDELDAESSYRVSFKRPAEGSCKIIAAFGGTEAASESRSSDKLKC